VRPILGVVGSLWQRKIFQSPMTSQGGRRGSKASLTRRKKNERDFVQAHCRQASDAAKDCPADYSKQGEQRMKLETMLTLAAALVLTAGVALATQSKTTNPQTTKASVTPTSTSAVHHEMGTVASVTSNELVLDHTWKGKQEKTNFTLDSATKKEGNVKQGDQVVVYYHIEKGQRIATELKASTKPETKKT
jgi:hypothetical protein